MTLVAHSFLLLRDRIIETVSLKQFACNFWFIFNEIGLLDIS